jgi:hypothetical protein
MLVGCSSAATSADTIPPAVGGPPSSAAGGTQLGGAGLVSESPSLPSTSLAVEPGPSGDGQSAGAGVALTTSIPAPSVPPAPVSVTTSPDPTPGPVETRAPAGDLAATLECIRSFEQGAAGYATNTGNGYYGAYQFSPQTWGGDVDHTGAVTRAGHPEWAGRLPSEAPAGVQDAAAAQLLSESGLGSWPTPARLCA